jgi:hypothetical protein
MIHAIVIAIALLLGACTTTPPADPGNVIKTTKTDGTTTIENLSDYAAYLKQAAESKPLFEMTCPPTGCVMTSLKVNMPSDKSSLQAPPPPPDTASIVFMKGLFGLGHDVIGLGPWAFGSRVLMKAFDKANSSVTNTTTTTDSSNRSTNSDSSNRSTTNTTSTTTTTTNTTDSNNTTHTCTSGTAGGTTTGAGGNSGAPTC